MSLLAFKRVLVLSGAAAAVMGACGDPEPVEVRRTDENAATWEMGAMEALAAGGAAGAGGQGAAALAVPTVKDIEEVSVALVEKLLACEVLGAGAYNLPHYDSLPANYCLMRCIVDTDGCDTAEGFLCGDSSDAWSECEERCETFTCGDGTEIPAVERCDTFVQCPDESDEWGCQGLWYQCQNGRPVLQSQVCNGANNCGDGSDELDCTVSFITCDNSRGYPEWEQCNGRAACSDSSDEPASCAQICDF